MAVSNSTKRVDARLEAARVYWGRGECRSFVFSDDTAGDQSGQYGELNVYDSSATSEYYWWLDDGSAVDPALPGRTGIQVSYTIGDLAGVIATAFHTAIESAGISCFAKLDAAAASVVVENWYPGAVATEATSVTDVVVSQLQAGVGGDLGATKEGIEMSMELTTVEVTANQFGALVLDDIGQGTVSSITAAFLETTDDFWKAVIGQVAGDEVEIPAGSDVVGFGESRLFQSLLDLGGRLILHPIRLDDKDRTDDICFWKSAPIPASLNFDGTDTQAMEVEFKPYLDASKDKRVNLWVRGDWTQEELDA